MTTIAVFGATGYSGGNIATEASARGHRVIAVARNTDPLAGRSDLDVRPGSLFDENFVREVASDTDMLVVALQAPRHWIGRIHSDTGPDRIRECGAPRPCRRRRQPARLARRTTSARYATVPGGIPGRRQRPCRCDGAAARIAGRRRLVQPVPASLLQRGQPRHAHRHLPSGRRCAPGRRRGKLAHRWRRLRHRLRGRDREADPTQNSVHRCLLTRNRSRLPGLPTRPGRERYVGDGR